MPTNLTQKLIAVIDKGKDIGEKLEAYNSLGEHLHQEYESHLEKLKVKATQLPKINNGKAAQ